MLQEVQPLFPVAIAQNWFLSFLENHAGKTGKIIRHLNWSETPLGPLACWPEGLKSSLSVCLSSIDRAIAIYWHEPKNSVYQAIP